MSAFGIYFLVLTTALILYYIIVIGMDLFKKSKKGRSDVDEIEVDDEDEQKSVVETDEGFDVSSGMLPEETDAASPENEDFTITDEEDNYVTDDEVATLVNEEDYTIGGGDDDEEPHDFPDSFGEDEIIADIRQQMDETLDDGNMEYQEVMDSTSFEVMMEQPRKLSASSKILKTFEND